MNWTNALSALALVLLSAPKLLPAQHLSLEAALYRGSVWRHTPKLTTQTGEALFAQELGLRVQTTGRRDWQAWQRFPSLGASLAHFQLGAGSHGRAFGFLPWLNVPVWRSARFETNFRIASGVAYVTQPYDWWKNRQQNAIGSHWNNVTQFRISAEAALNSHARLLAGACFTHFSNGGIALPNFGINILSAWVGAAWSPQALRPAQFRQAGASRKVVSRRIGLLGQAGFTAVQIATFDGPKYPVWTGALSVFYRFNRLHRASAGLDVEHNHSIRVWGLHSARFADEVSARRGATRLAWFVGEEFLFGDIGIQLQVGRYFGRQMNAFVPKQVYSKLAMRYYLPERFGLFLQPFVGITLKAHAFTAEYMTLNAGISL